MEIRVPDIGDFKDVPVIEVLVKPGDAVAKETPLVVLESEKASMEVPSSAAGVVADVKVKPGDKVSQGSLIVTLAAKGNGAAATSDGAATRDGDNSSVILSGAPEGRAVEGPLTTVDLVVPDLGDFKDVPVIEVLVKPGDAIAKEAPLVVLESEKASMEVPASAAGTIADVRVKPGDKVSQGSVIATITTSGGPSTEPVLSEVEGLAPARSAQDDTAKVLPSAPLPSPPVAPPPVAAPPTGGSNGKIVHASPAIRRFARELGVDLHVLSGTGPHGRVTREDVQGYVKSALASGPSTSLRSAQDDKGFAGLPAWPKVDFAQYGPIERKALPRIKKLSGPNLHRNWLQIPHITNYDEADITELEAFRTSVNAEQAKKKDAPKLTMLAFLVKASVAALQRFPEFNASLDGDELVYKRYYNIGFAADTPNGLVVPVLKGADAKGLLEIAHETAELAGKAREGKLGLSDMQGGTFTISSIGGIGGTGFTQIINAPEVAILGAVRSTMKPVWNGNEFVPRLILPIDVSYDHRVIDGALAARFLAYLTSLLADFKRVTL
jgi:pyruvate dehydrogenase E2 component (dihydrolipoamide acetyltransferase)